MNITSTRGLHNEQIKCLITGVSGSGKTTAIGTLPAEETLIISAESGLLSLGDKSIDVIEITKYSQIQDAYRFVLSTEAEKYKTIAIDSLTEISDMLVSHLEKQPEYSDPKNTMKLWGRYNKDITALIKAFRGLAKNVIFTALTEDVNDGGILVKKPLIKGNSAQSMLCSYFDEVLYLLIDPATGERQFQTQPSSNLVAKDRSGKLQEREPPDLQHIFNTIRGISA